jgi:hypothetical protein
MPSADKQRLNDLVLSRYLLGSLPAEEAERLDELSVADDEFALRLDAAENDLVDAYARGELSGDALEQFQKFYLSSPRRREKLEFARTLLHSGERTADAGARATTRHAIPGAKPTDQTSQSSSLRRWFTVPRLRLQWGFAFAAVALLFGGSYLFVENERLRHQANEARNQQIALNQHAQELEKQLDEQRSTNASTVKELDRLRETLPPPRALKIVAALLLPQMRGVGEAPTVSVPPGTDQVQLRLQLESNDFPAYQVALRDPVTNQVLWRSAKLKAKLQGDAVGVSISLAASLLKQQNYMLELYGAAGTSAELMASYPFRVVLK